MTRRLLLAATAVLVVGGATAPALAASAATDSERICVALSSGPGKEPSAPLCIWYPGR